MKRTSKSFLVLFVAILLVMSFPLTTSESIRGFFASMFSPLWEVFNPDKGVPSQNNRESVHTDPYQNSMPDIPEPSRDAVAARIIFRSPSTWNSSLWINVGQETNESYEKPLVAKNSPVLVGDCVVGVIDYVGRKQSRVRLITDSGLVPSVRVARGGEQNRALAENVNDLISYIHTHGEFFEDPKEKSYLEEALQKFKYKLFEKRHTWYLAKGEIHGQSHPSWRTDGHILKGSGFNYDFEDEWGPARDLRTGEPLIANKEFKSMPLVKIHDLLITTGMDGVFPPHLKIGTVTKIDLLREGDYSFELEAKPSVGNLDELNWVYVIAPLGYDEKDQPPIR